MDYQQPIEAAYHLLHHQINFSNWHELERLSPIPEWHYSARHEAQMILPGLYLGPFGVARSLTALRQYGISHVICVRDPTEKQLVRPVFGGSNELRDPMPMLDHGPPIHYLTLEFSERTTMRILSTFTQAAIFCRQAWYGKDGVPGAVLIHCRTGIEVGATVAVAVVMALTGMTCRDAMLWVKMRRRCANLRDAYQRLLLEYAPLVAAQYGAMQTRYPHHVLNRIDDNTMAMHEDFSSQWRVKRTQRDYFDEDGKERLAYPHTRRR